MATVVSKKLSIDNSNIEQYCDANNVSFNVSGHAWRKWLNGSTDGYIILKTEGKSVIYPTDTAKPIKADSTISASRSAGTCTVDLQFGGTEVHKESYTSGSQTSKSKSGITDAAVTNSTKATEIRWHVYGANSNNQRGSLLELTLYFNQYTMSANIGTGATGVKSVSSSASVAYDGDTITFSAELYNGATWYGWYSDAACINLVSSAQSYSVSPNSDITLYAKATLDVALYTCAAVAGTEISSATVSETTVVDGGTCTFTATVNTGCTFDGWYSDSSYSTLVSTSNPYTATITADTTLYAKATRKQLKITVGSAEHGTAMVSAATVAYGSNVTFTFTPENETWELYGWYSDSALTQLVSEANPYTFTVTEDVTLYPKVGAKRYTITLESNGNIIMHSATSLSIIVVDTEKATAKDLKNLRAGYFSLIPSDKTIDSVIKTGNYSSTYSATVQATIGSTVGLRAEIKFDSNDDRTTYFLKDSVQITNGPYYVFTADSDAVYTTYVANKVNYPYRCDCDAIGLAGIDSAEVYPRKVIQGATTEYSAVLSSGYSFNGWYSDKACTTLVSSNNPAQVTAPKYTGDTAAVTTLTLYAKATPISGTSTQIYLKQNGAYTQAQAIYKKVNGVWTATDKTTLDTTTKYKIINT